MNFVSRLDKVCPLISALKSKSKPDCLAHQASVTMLNMLYIHICIYVFTNPTSHKLFACGRHRCMTRDELLHL